MQCCLLVRGLREVFFVSAVFVALARYCRFCPAYPFLPCSLMADTPVVETKLFLCTLCNLRYEQDKGRVHGRKFHCTPCASADRLLRRGLGDKGELQSMPVSEQHAFFRKLHEERKANPDNRLNWQSVRASLISTLTTRQMTESSTTINSEFLPLSVWVARGWDAATVKRNSSEWSNELDTWTYQVPVKSKTWKETYAQVEERVLRQEREATLRRASKKGKDAGGAESDGELDVPKASAGKENKSEDNAEKKEAQRLAAAQRKAKGTNQKLQILSAKALAPLAQDLQSLQRLRARVTDEVPSGVESTYQEQLEKLKTWNQAAKQTVAQWEDPKVQTGEVELTALPFDMGDVKTLHKTVQEVQSSLKSLLPVPKPKSAKRKAGAEEEQKEGTGAAGTAAEKEALPKRRREKGPGTK